MMSSGRSMRFPFTPSQWQELEHQALIYKYMVSGIPIPPDLLFSIKRSCLDSPHTLPSKLFSHHPSHIGWNCFQMGLGRKIDPEPGRCRRTDGKKWRCSKEAFGDSKYCERHMHRGKNRSRKPVEVFKTTPPTPSSNSNTNSNTSPITKIVNPPPHSLHSLSSLSSSESSYNSGTTHLDDHPFLYSRPSGNIGLSHQERSTSLLLDSASFNNIPLHPNLEYRPNRYGYGVKEEVDEHAFFSEPSGSVRGFSGSSSSLDHHHDSNWQLTMNGSNSSSKQRTCSVLQSEHFPRLQLQNFTDSNLGKMESRQERTIHHFFDEGPLKDRDSWLDLDDKSSNSGSASTTRLSISIPASAHDFPIFSSRNHNED